MRLQASREKLSSINVNTFTQTHEWRLYPNVCERQRARSVSTFTLEHQDSIELTMCVVRKPSYYYWNSFFLIFVVAMLYLCTFSIHCDLVGYRLLVSIIVLLALVTLKLTIANDLPSISYLTSLDQYSFMNILIGLIICIYFAIIGGLVNSGCVSPLKEVDFYAFITATAFFYLLNSLFVIKFFVFKYRNVKRIEQREIEYGRNNTARKARLKSIFRID